MTTCATNIFVASPRAVTPTPIEAMGMMHYRREKEREEKDVKIRRVGKMAEEEFHGSDMNEGNYVSKAR